MSLFARLFRRRKASLTPDLAAEIRRSFEEAAADEEHFPSTIDPRILHVRAVIDGLAPLGQGARVLDAGCGKGRFAVHVKSAYPEAQVVALDLATAMLRSAPPELRRVAGSMLELPFGESAFEAVYATESLEHAVDIEAAVAELCRVLKPGGRLVIIDKNARIGAGAVVPPGKVVESGELWLGNPAKPVRRLSDREIEQLYYSAKHYVRLKDQYLGLPPG